MPRPVLTCQTADVVAFSRRLFLQPALINERVAARSPRSGRMSGLTKSRGE